MIKYRIKNKNWKTTMKDNGENYNNHLVMFVCCTFVCLHKCLLLRSLSTSSGDDETSRGSPLTQVVNLMDLELTTGMCNDITILYDT